MTSCYEGRHKPLIKLVNDLQVHIGRRPHLFIDQVKGRMRDELVQVSMIISLEITKDHLTENATIVSANIKRLSGCGLTE